MKKAIYFFLFSNFFVSFGAVLMLYDTVHRFQLKMPVFLYLFFFFATLSSYCLHDSVGVAAKSENERTNWAMQHQKLLLVLFCISSICVLVLAYPLLSFLPYIVPLALLTLLYTAPKIERKPFIWLRKIAICKTLYLALVWATVTVLLPIISAKATFQTPHFFYFLHRFGFILAICILFDYRDREIDQQVQLKNWITYSSPAKLYLALGFSIGLSLLSAFLWVGFSFQLIETIIPIIMLISTLPISIRTQNDIWFYGFLDGILMIAGLMLFLQQSLS